MIPGRVAYLFLACLSWLLEYAIFEPPVLSALSAASDYVSSCYALTNRAMAILPICSNRVPRAVETICIKTARYGGPCRDP